MATEAETTELHAILEKLDADELEQVKKRVEGLISDYQNRKRQNAVSAAEQAAQDHGFKLADLIGEAKPGKRRKATAPGTSGPAKYKNPDNPDQTWTGRGRRPAWVVTVLEAGGSMEDLAI